LHLQIKKNIVLSSLWFVSPRTIGIVRDCNCVEKTIETNNK